MSEYSKEYSLVARWAYKRTTWPLCVFFPSLAVVGSRALSTVRTSVRISLSASRNATVPVPFDRCGRPVDPSAYDECRYVPACGATQGVNRGRKPTPRRPDSPSCGPGGARPPTNIERQHASTAAGYNAGWKCARNSLVSELQLDDDGYVLAVLNTRTERDGAERVRLSSQ